MTASGNRSIDRLSPAQLTGLILPPALAGLMLVMPAPAGLSAQGWATAAVGMLMALWWMAAIVPLAVTALLPLALFPMIGIVDLDTVAGFYSDPLIFLFLGGFLLAKAMERCQLHRRLAFLAARSAGQGPRILILSMMVTTAFLSMWVSNTATAMVMIPIAQSLIATMRERGGAEQQASIDSFGAALVLAIAYAATIGGMGTLIGTPPNALFSGFMQNAYGITISFAHWMLIGVPIVLVLLPLAWLVLTHGMISRYRTDDLSQLTAGVSHAHVPGRMSREERLVGLILALTALAWISRPLIVDLWPSLPISDAGIAMMAAILLFVLPVRAPERVFLLEWSDAQTIRWDVLILFGGGLALAGAIHNSGLAEWIGGGLSAIQVLPTILQTLIIMVAIVYLGELASNTAIAAVFLPIVGMTAASLSQSPISLMLPVALAASLGFMLPVATPPNAIAYGSGAITARQMLRYGAVLDVITTPIVAAFALILGPLLFG